MWALFFDRYSDIRNFEVNEKYHRPILTEISWNALILYKNLRITKEARIHMKKI